MEKIKKALSQIFLILAIWFFIYVAYSAKEWNDNRAYDDTEIPVMEKPTNESILFISRVK